MELEDGRVYYEHDANCSGTIFTPVGDRGLKKCLDCAGIFKADGTPVAVTDKRFDSWRTEFNEIPTEEG